MKRKTKSSKQKKYGLTKDEALAVELVELWDQNEECMGEQAALHVACEMLGIDPECASDVLIHHPKARAI